MFGVSSGLAFYSIWIHTNAAIKQNIIKPSSITRVISFMFYLWIATEQSLDRLDDPAENSLKRLSRSLEGR
jgi:hypothetical protein